MADERVVSILTLVSLKKSARWKEGVAEPKAAVREANQSTSNLTRSGSFIPTLYDEQHMSLLYSSSAQVLVNKNGKHDGSCRITPIQESNKRLKFLICRSSLILRLVPSIYSDSPSQS